METCDISSNNNKVRGFRLSVGGPPVNGALKVVPLPVDAETFEYYLIFILINIHKSLNR